MKRFCLIAGALALAACTSKVDPNKGHFACDGGDDCGAGYECRPQVGAGGLCYPAGACSAETCNGADDDCDGVVDDNLGELGQSCSTGKPGICATGAQACADGGLVCVQTRQPTTEVCDGQDNNCNGQVDEGFDFTADNQNCGSCNHACATGSACSGSACHETNCGNGIDDDGDQLVDCADNDCVGLACDPNDAGSNCGAALVPFDAGTAPDAGDDGGLDAGVDAGADAGVDAGADAGLDAGFDAGVYAPACVPRESNCANGVDDDSDGTVDCADVDCDGKSCGTGNKKCANLTCQ